MTNKQILEGEALYKKIEKLKQVHVDSDNWLILYVDEDNGEKWVKEYPNSEFHAGGAPRLRIIDKFPWES